MPPALSVRDVAVWFDCAHDASSWPSQVEVFDGSSSPASPHRLGVLVQATDQVNGRLLRVRSVAITARLVEVDLAAYTSADPMCCPSLDVRRAYAWDGNGFTRAT